MESIKIKNTTIYYSNTFVSSNVSKIEAISLLKLKIINKVEDGEYDDIYFYINLINLAETNYHQITNPTYKEIVEELFDNKKLSYTNNLGLVCSIKGTPCDLTDANLSDSIKSLKRLMAINRFNNIVSYYNSKTNFDNVRFYIEYDEIHDAFYVETKHGVITGMPFFYRKEDAELVINNQNLQPLLKQIFQ